MKRKSKKISLIFNEYIQWLKQKNFALETIKKYLGTIKQYGNRKIDTCSIANFLRENLTKYEPATLRGKRNVVSLLC